MISVECEMCCSAGGGDRDVPPLATPPAHTRLTPRKHSPAADCGQSQPDGGQSRCGLRENVRNIPQLGQNEII